MTREEAIKIVRENMHLSYDEGNIFEALETLVPELHESKDEKIRKALIQEFKEKVQKSFEWKDGIPNNAVLDWLEKQKEQKSLNISAASEWLKEHVCGYMNSGYNEFHKCVEYDGSIDKERLISDFEEAMQKEQKPEVECDNETEVQKAYREGKNAGRKEVFDHPEYYGLQLRRMYDYETGKRNPEWGKEDIEEYRNEAKFNPKPGDNFWVRCKSREDSGLWFEKGDERPAYTIDDGMNGIQYIVCLDKDGKGNAVSYQNKESFLETFEIIEKQ